MRELARQDGQSCGNVVSPDVELVRDALRREHLGEPAGAGQGPGRVDLPRPLPDDEHQVYA